MIGWLLRLLHLDRTLSERVTGALFCTECDFAGDNDRCMVKNRTIREQSRACRWWMMKGGAR